MDKQLQKDIRYLRMATIWAGNSYAIRLNVGCLIVKDESIISDGYNGTPRGFENVCEEYVGDDSDRSKFIQQELEAINNDEEKRDYLRKLYINKHTLVSKPYVLHAEANAITKLARSTQSCDGATLYCTDMPCMECSKLIIQSGICRVVYERPYRITDGVDLLKRAGIEVVNIPTETVYSREFRV